ncbi:hypothetical protein D5H75_10610 [Bailinhaonella thermotolerans]|uniref:Condensation domain-containing protein n=1 Tax=Bailinhaonella thermotolerans TaxID=1070861 RepID=A0A3A4B6Y5_9ACTN|nr:hypothetical protein D5H75_10610 [Bailinhaonella thermotolerans]
MLWSQEMYWFIHNVPLPTVDSPKIAVEFDVRGAGAPAVRAALGELIARHESLRTTYPRGAGGRPYQRVHPPYLPEFADGGTREEVVAALTAAPMDPERDLPVRAGLVAGPGGPELLVLVFNHIAIDRWSAVLLKREFAGLLGGLAGPAVAGAGPADLARRQSAERNARALRHWEDVLTTMPGHLFPQFRPRRGGPFPSYVECELDSAVLGAASARVAERHGTSQAVVFTALFGICLSSWSGNPRVPVLSNFANRDRANGGTVACLFQPALIGLGLAREDSLARALDEAAARSPRGHRHARYSYWEMRRIRALLGRARGVQFRNPPTLDYAESAEPGGGPDRPTSLTIRECPWEDDYADAYLRVRRRPDRCVLTLTGHTSIFDGAQARALLTGVEGLLTAWAADPAIARLPLADLARRFRLPARRYGAAWAYADHCWVDTDAVAAAIEAVPGVRRATVTARPIGGETRLRADVVTDDPALTPARLRIAALDAAHHAASVIAPHWFTVRGGGQVLRGPGTERLAWAPEGEDERLLAAAITSCHPGAEPDMSASYAEIGGGAPETRAVCERLREHGRDDVTPEDLLSSTSLRAIAGPPATRRR